MTQGPFLLRLCQSGTFTEFQSIFFFVAHLCRSGKPSVTARAMNGTSRHGRRANRKNTVSDAPNLVWASRYGILLLKYVCPVSRFRHGSLSFSVVSFRYGFLWGIFFSQYASASVYLHFRVFQLSASGGHSRSGRKGNSGIVRKCKVKPPVSSNNLQPCG